MVGAGTGQRSLVLVVEDDPAIAALLAEVVRDIIGADVVAVSDLDRASPVGVDLVITDLIGGDTYRPDAGRRYLRRLRARFPFVAVLLLTGRLWAREAAHTLPVDEVVSKPFDLDDLADRIRALLPSSHRSAA